MYVVLVPILGASEGDSAANDSPGLLIYPVVMRALSLWRFRYSLTEGRKEGILVVWLPGRAEWDPCACTEVALVLPQCCAMEAPHNQVVVRVVPGVPGGDILE